MTSTAFFQTRARAIDHLGRGQIADAPTAISELWKNSHDAYATHVALHIFEGPPHVAAVVDNGCGMSLEDIQERWLVVGTESKATGDLPTKDRLGLDPRPKLGEKGIGRLSAGFLAPVTLLVTKKKRESFVATLVDWRFFENPFLMITDIPIPIEEFDSLDQLPKLFDKMLKSVQATLEGSHVGQRSEKTRIQKAWKDFSKQERSEGKLQTTEKLIKTLKTDDILTDERLAVWSVSQETSEHGTALFLIDLHHELSVWVDPEVDSTITDAEEIKTRTIQRQTLTGFVDPESSLAKQFDYELIMHRKEKNTPTSINLSKELSSEWLRTLEHYFRGTIGEDGKFKGEVIVFGKPRGKFEYLIKVPGLLDKNGKSRVGEFSIEAATIEQEADSSTHDISEREAILRAQDDASGFMLYRDGIRVMPYGRIDSDFFELEERRGRHAGREFWAHRRIFGRVRISRERNPELKDKAGREGIVDNRAKRLMKEAVVNVLKSAARKYYGTDSDIRKPELEIIKAKNKRKQQAAENVRKKRRTVFLASLKRVIKQITPLELRLETTLNGLETAKQNEDQKLYAKILV